MGPQLWLGRSLVRRLGMTHAGLFPHCNKPTSLFTYLQFAECFGIGGGPLVPFLMITLQPRLQLPRCPPIALPKIRSQPASRSHPTTSPAAPPIHLEDVGPAEVVGAGSQACRGQPSRLQPSGEGRILRVRVNPWMCKKVNGLARNSP